MIFLGSDHAGYGLKKEIKKYLAKKGMVFSDVGCFSDDVPSNYAIVAHRLCRNIKKNDRGILVCGSGSGMNIVANKYPHVRAVSSNDPEIIEMSRKHNDINVLCLGARYFGDKKPGDVLKKFFNAKFEDGRHKKRLEKVKIQNLPKISVSILGINPERTKKIQELLEDKIDFWHIDVMDGIFVENQKDYSGKELNLLKKPLDFHFMVEDPEQYLLKYKKYFKKSLSIAIHAESKYLDEKNNKLKKLIKSIKNKCAVEFGIAINPETKIDDKIRAMIAYFDFILIMSVIPGKGGQKFIYNILKKIAQLQKAFPSCPVRVDGGINSESVEKLKGYDNVDMITVGSYITKSEDPDGSLGKLKLI